MLKHLKNKINNFGSIKSRIVLLIFIVSTPSVGLISYHAHLEKQTQIKQTIALADGISSRIVKSQQKIINDSRKFLETLSKEPFLQQPDSLACNEELAAIIRLNKTYVNIGAPLLNGDLLCNATPLSKPVNVAHREYIQTAIKEEAFSISKMQTDIATGQSSMNFAYPIRHLDNNEVIALIVAVSSFNWWNELLEFYNLPEESTAYIIDNASRIVAEYPFNLDNIDLQLKDDYQRTDDSISISEDSFIKHIDGVPYIFYDSVLYKRNADNFIRFVLKIPVTTILAINQNFYLSIFTYIFITFLVSAYAMSSSNKNIINPIKQLVRATNNLETGKKTHLLAHIGADEIRQLSRQFIKMSDTRLLAEKESISRSKELNSVFRALPDTYIRVSAKGDILDYKDGISGNTDRDVLPGLTLYDLFEKNIADIFMEKISWQNDNPGSTSKPWEYDYGEGDKKSTFEVRITQIHRSSELVIIIREVTERKKSEEAIWKHANFDSLTQLPNRKFFYEKLEQVLTNAKTLNQRFAVLFIDLDQFKEVNDTLGHHVGDKLLQEVANRLVKCVRKTDVVARLGGDEFTIIVDHLEDTQTVEHIASKILKEVHKSINLGEEVCYISPSIGISLYPDNCSTVDELIKTADQAMYAAKQMGRNRFNYYESSMQIEAMKRMHLINDLRTAITKQQFHLLYQPIIDMRTGAIIKAEALIRWEHPEKGLIRPDEFIALAEDTELIFPMGYWVIKEVDSKLAEFTKKFGDNFQISINISPLQFMNQDPIKNKWFEAINHSPNKHKLILEITEGLLIDSSNETKEKFQTFAEKGIPLAIDDFGTGYSSLAYINQYEIDFLKIDRSFVMDLSQGSNNLVLCEAIIVMAHKLGIKVIAEGVETQEQYALLASINCDFAQGYYLSRPCTHDDFLDLDKTLISEDLALSQQING